MSGDQSDHTQRLKLTDIPHVLRGKVMRARLALLWERVWPACWPLLATVTIFLITALSGIWTLSPVPLRILFLVIFAGALLLALRPIYRLPLPTLADGLRRVERVSNVPHRPATAYMDELSGSGGGETAALWQAHKARMARMIAALRVGLPRSYLLLRDPYALRAVLGLCLVIAIAFAGADWRTRLASPFSLAEGGTNAALSIDAWVNPPAYTSKRPIYLEAIETEALDQPIEIPAGSELVVRVQDGNALALTIERLNQSDSGDSDNSDGAADTLPDIGTSVARDGAREFRVVLQHSLSATLGEAASPLRHWAFQIVPDTPPTIALTETPQAAASGALKLSYEVSDDYGVIGADAHVRESPMSAMESDEQPLVEAPRFPLSLPRLRARAGTAETYKELLSHPWAGADVEIVLKARDEAGNEASSEPVRIVLPARPFAKPLAKALVEQRRILALTPSHRSHVVMALDALSISPMGVYPDMGSYLAVRIASWRLRNSQDREEMASVLDLLWDTALHIEDGDLSLAERNLRDAQDALARALQNNAPAEELERLMKELRQAMNEYLRSLAEALRNMPEGSPEQQLSSDQILRSEDLQRMLDNIENMARSGAREQAKRMLDELRNMMENLQAGRMQQATPQQQEMARSLQELGNMIGRQQKLMDDTFRLDQQGNRSGEQQNGSDPEAPHTGPLADQQAQLQEDLQKLIERMKNLGMNPNSALDKAGENMGNASEALGQGDTQGALPSQGDALDSLREGAREMAEQLAEQMMQFGPQGRQADNATDPLGRPNDSRGDYNPPGGPPIVPNEIDSERVRQILRELRDRLSTPGRPKLELDYLERLLRQF